MIPLNFMAQIESRNILGALSSLLPADALSSPQQAILSAEKTIS